MAPLFTARDRGSHSVPTYSISGIRLETDVAFRWPLVRTEGPPDVRFHCVGSAPITVDWDRRHAAHTIATAGVVGPPDIAFHDLGGVDVVRIRGIADHYVWADRIVCHVRDPDWAALVEVQLLGLVLALWLERRGVPTLHASAAVVDGAAVAFLGDKGGGKTTAAAALLASGHRLLADDLLALRHEGTHVMAAPGYPMLRLWPEQVEHFVGDGGDLPLVHPSFSKRRITVGSDLGDFHASPVPLCRVYLPRRTLHGEITVTPVRSRDALIALVRNSFLHDAVHGLGLARSRLVALAEVVEHVQVRVLRYPNGFDRLEALVGAVESDLAVA